MVDKTLFLFVARVKPDLTVRVGGFKGFEERGWKWVDKMFFRDIVE